MIRDEINYMSEIFYRFDEDIILQFHLQINFVYKIFRTLGNDKLLNKKQFSNA